MVPNVTQGDDVKPLPFSPGDGAATADATAAVAAAVAAAAVVAAILRLTDVQVISTISCKHEIHLIST